LKDCKPFPAHLHINQSAVKPATCCNFNEWLLWP
jgi:hypothetical protein